MIISIAVFFFFLSQFGERAADGPSRSGNKLKFSIA